LLHPLQVTASRAAVPGRLRSEFRSEAFTSKFILSLYPSEDCLKLASAPGRQYGGLQAT